MFCHTFSRVAKALLLTELCYVPALYHTQLDYNYCSFQYMYSARTISKLTSK